MKVGVLPVLDQSAGGIYQYSLTVLDAMAQLRGEMDAVIVYDPARTERLRPWTTSGWQVVSTAPPSPRKQARSTIARLFGESAAARTAAIVRKATGDAVPLAPGQLGAIADGFGVQRRDGVWLARHGIELMLYPVPSRHSFEGGLPYAMAIHDLQHRIHPEFPEVSAGGEWEAREYLFRNGVRYAEAIVVDSDVGRDDVLEFYGDLISPDRVRVLPFILPPYIAKPTAHEVEETLNVLGIHGRYLLFPAQFWPHKNHRRVVEAVAELHRDGIDVTVVMTGSATGPIRGQTLAEVRDVVVRKGIDELIQILGYVEDTAMGPLYAGATGVLLPTFFGPTNIPVIEAWAMGVPVLTSDIRGIREQCGEAAILVDPLSTEAIADGIRRLWTDGALRGRLVAAGRGRVTDHDPAAFRDELANILRDARRNLRIPDTQRMPA